jgi:hypothetical protein
LSSAGSAASASSVALGSFANASSVGAKTVNGPGPASTASSPVAWSSFTSVVKSPAATAVSTMFFAGAGVSDGGMSTESTAWMMPLLALMSAATTLLSLTWSPPPAVAVKLTFSPSIVVAEPSVAACAAVTRPLTTWYSSTFLSSAGSAPSASSVAFGTLANASSVGAKTVNGPSCESVPARPACLTRLTSVLKSPAATAVCTMFFLP